MEKVKTHRYLGAQHSNDGRMSQKVNLKAGDALKTAGALSSLWKMRHMYREAKFGLYERIS